MEVENKELKKQIESQKGLITVGGKQQYETTMAYDKYKTALEEIRAMINFPDHRGLLNKIEDKINEVLDVSL